MSEAPNNNVLQAALEVLKNGNFPETVSAAASDYLVASFAVAAPQETRREWTVDEVETFAQEIVDRLNAFTPELVSSRLRGLLIAEIRKDLTCKAR